MGTLVFQDAPPFEHETGALRRQHPTRRLEYSPTEHVMRDDQETQSGAT
jgi:hypothetical protein